MSAKGACSACRTRKVKCTPSSTPRCERCTTLGVKYCVYESVKKRGAGGTLRAGEACNRCRSRKTKCDAKRPCTRCIEGGIASECEDEIIDASSNPFSQPRFLLWNKPDPSLPMNLSKERWTVGDAVPGSSTNTNTATAIQPTLGEVLSAPALSRSSPPSLVSPVSRLHAVNEVETHRPYSVALPPFSIPLPRIHTRIPPEPHIALLLMGAERLQLSDVALGELDMKFRISALCRLSKLGIRFTSGRQQAMLGGDTSGIIIHPFFIPAAQALGMYFCEGMESSPAMVRLHAKHIQICLEWLAEIFKGNDWELRAQVALWVTSASITLSLNDYYIPLYMQRGCEAINTGGLRFIPTYGRPPAFSEDLHEKLSVLSQIIYFENFLFLTHGGEEPKMTARIEEEFRHQLPYTHYCSKFAH
ncbi:hypothetical protein BJ322DRAFT_829801 [Thelephora terrestris]|uniref:Zn(2)-C6 fungal-type domain-containing protein n=1 Tax=Thelephora terrestris TaxID=56493 RepID=A0A9P6HF65_9AGAM|nr:hypothetical protein BJ322DRAFT_829801 [Thelephora terrestris]